MKYKKEYVRRGLPKVREYISRVVIKGEQKEINCTLLVIYHERKSLNKWQEKMKYKKI